MQITLSRLRICFHVKGPFSLLLRLDRLRVSFSVLPNGQRKLFHRKQAWGGFKLTINLLPVLQERLILRPYLFVSPYIYCNCSSSCCIFSFLCKACGLTHYVIEKKVILWENIKVNMSVTLAAHPQLTPKLKKGYSYSSTALCPFMVFIGWNLPY